MFKDLAANSDASAAAAVDNLVQEKGLSKVNQNLRLFYQHLIMKLIRDCGVLEDEEHDADLNNFLKINEFSERA